MVLHGPPTPLSGSQPVPPSLLRTNSNLLSGQGSGMPSQNAFPSLVSPCNQLNNINKMGNAANVSSLLQQSFNNGGPSSGLSVLGKRRLIENGGVTNVTGFNPSPHLSVSITTDPNSSGQVQGQQQQFPNPTGNQMLADQLHTQQLDPQNFQNNQHQLLQFSVPGNQQQLPFQTTQAGLGSVGPVKPEMHAMNDQTRQQLQALRNLGTVKLEPQQILNMRSLVPANMESQQPESSSFLNKQQQQLLLSRQSPQAAAAAQILHQRRHMQIQRQQQQRALNTIPQQKSQLQAQFQPQNLSIRSPVKTVYEPGMGAQRLTYYMYQQQQRPEDNNIEFWRKFVADFFATNAKKKWCVSMYASCRQTTGVLNQDVWHCEICNRKPGRGYEATAEVLPRLFKIKFESGTMEELLYVDMPKESQNSSGQIVLDYAKAIQESVFEQLRVVRDGQLRIIFSPDLKICSWEFCARRHEELIPKRLLIPQVSQLGAAAQRYQTATQNRPSDVFDSELQNNCNMFVASARQLGKALEVPLVNDVGYTKRYVRCLQISEVVNSMKDLIDYSSESRSGPMESLLKYPRLNPPHDFQGEPQQPGGHLQQQQQIMVQNSNNNGSVQAPAMQQLASTNGGMLRVSNTLNSVPAITPAGANIGLVHQNSMNSRQQNPMYTANSPYEGNNVPIQSPGSSNIMPQPQSSPAFQSQKLPSSNNPLQQTSHGGLSGGAHVISNSPNISMQQPVALSGDADANDSQSSVQKIIQEMMSSQLGGGSMMNTRTMSNDVKNVNGLSSSINNSGLSGRNGVIANGVASGNLNIGGAGFGTLGNELGQSGMVDGIQATLENNSMNMNRRAGVTVAQGQSTNQPQQNLENQLLGGLGAANDFNDLQFDWKPSP